MYGYSGVKTNYLQNLQKMNERFPGSLRTLTFNRFRVVCRLSFVYRKRKEKDFFFFLYFKSDIFVDQIQRQRTGLGYKCHDYKLQTSHSFRPTVIREVCTLAENIVCFIFKQTLVNHSTATLTALSLKPHQQSIKFEIIKTNFSPLH